MPNEPEGYDPDKITELRKELDNPKKSNLIALLYDVMVIARGLDQKPLVELLRKELTNGYGDEEVPIYRKFALGEKTMIFIEPLGKFKSEYRRKVFRSGNGTVSIVQIVEFIYQGIEREDAWLDFRTELVKHGVKKKVSEMVQEERKSVQKIDLSGLKNE
jgi:hypothetical protein